ncbi:type IVB secretion system protein IcmH/DotU [Limibaculum sp. FT325]|uniref:type IVB secretion system protein IcmH/DotU n=1 Tax=Thermohalobaculum sediminis TaxID=2939436 RepID=UPI0020C189E1|nr:type IVB secretion system protein IcmH/DotU [Limibaculum sediminis]MCL5777315.1 type IVB secretion system protein IcmH/DotU [Limibaculum sediminis]
MSRDDPFAEPSDTEKTVIRPNPGGRRPAAPQPAPAAAPSAPPQQAAGGALPLGQAATGLNPLNAAASTLFSLVGRIRNRAQHANPEALRESVIAEIRAFESRALQAGVPAQTVKVARYAICATVDDVVLNTPWGGTGVWAQSSMVGTFHKETHGGERFYDLLARLEQEPGTNRDLLEFLYMCLSLGFEGRLRVEPRGTEKHIAIRDGLARLIRSHRGPIEHDLSPRWKGVDVAHRPISALAPVWLISGVTLLVLCLTYFGFAFALSGDTERLQGQLSALDLRGPIELARAAPPPPPPPPPPAAVERIEKIRKFLEPEINEGLVTVFEDANTLTVRIAGEGMFGSGSDVLEPKFRPIVDRVAEALNEEPGKIIVAGHSDNVPIRTARFPSNLHLSLARAEAVMHKIAERLELDDRLSAEGRAEKEPIAPNATPEGRAKNRRIEVILVKAG